MEPLLSQTQSPEPDHSYYSRTEEGNNIYSGIAHWDDGTSIFVSIQVTAFDSDGDILTWELEVDSN